MKSKETYTIEEFRIKFGDKAVTKVVQLWGHKEIEDTEITKNCTYELNASCNMCSNCNGVPCCEITYNNPNQMKDIKKHYPEHDKLKNVQEQSQFLGEFMDWLSSEGYSICEVEERSNRLDYFPTNKSINTLLSDMFQIDLIKLEKEKREMLSELQTQS